MSFALGNKSRVNLNGVHPNLVRVVELAIKKTTVDFTVTEGLRTIERQKQLVAAGASKTLSSRHITGHAIDLAALIDGKVEWSWPLYSQIATAMKQAAAELNIQIEWGGDWKTFKDGPHFQLSRSAYP
jgi:peptidoglycan L-alanyl-D-glutamate endopeptidase CwlK